MAMNPGGAALDDKLRAFPTPGTPMARILYDDHFRQTFGAKLKKSNPFVVFFYRLGLLPLFGASRTMMILTTRGCKSGKIRRTPIGYFPVGGVVHIFSAWGRSASWYKNLIADPCDVQIQIGLRPQKVRPEVLEDPAEIWQTLQQFMSESPKAATYLFGWDPLTDRIDAADFSELIQKVVFVRCINL